MNRYNGPEFNMPTPIFENLWFKTCEKLPSKDGTYIVFYNEEVRLSCYSLEYAAWFDCATYLIMTPSHWKYLSLPPDDENRASFT